MLKTARTSKLAIIARGTFIPNGKFKPGEAGFEKLGGSIHNVDAQAIHTHDFSRLPYRRRHKPMYPLDNER